MCPYLLHSIWETLLVSEGLYPVPCTMPCPVPLPGHLPPLSMHTACEEREDGGEIVGSRVYFSLHTGETPSQSIEKQSEQPTVPQHI